MFYILQKQFLNLHRVLFSDLDLTIKVEGDRLALHHEYDVDVSEQQYQYGDLTNQPDLAKNLHLDQPDELNSPQPDRDDEQVSSLLTFLWSDEFSPESLLHRSEDQAENDELVQASLATAKAAWVCKQTEILEPETTAVAHLSAGDTEFQQGRVEAAIDHYRQAIALDPAFSEAYQHLAEALTHQGQLEEAAACYRQAITLAEASGTGVSEDVQPEAEVPLLDEPEQTEDDQIPWFEQASFYVQQASVHCNVEDWTAAIATCRKALEHLQPGAGAAYFMLGRALQAEHQLEAAEQAYQTALLIQPQSAEVLARLGSLYTQQHCLDRAIEFYQRAISLQPDFAGAHWKLSELWWQLGDRQKAALSRYAAVQQQPDWATAPEYLQLGNLLLEVGQAEQAIDCYRWAIERNQITELQPENAIAWHDLGDVLNQLERWSEAVEAFRQAIALNPNFSWSHNNLADALMRLERWQEAAEAYQQAIALHPDFHWSHYNLGEALVKLAQWDGAIAAYQQALTVCPDLSCAQAGLAEALQNRVQTDSDRAISAYRYAAQDDPEKLHHYHKALALDSKRVEVYIELANALFEQNKLNGAITFYEIARRFKEDDPQIYQRIGEILVNQKRYEQAIANLQRAAEISSDEQTHYLMGLCLEEMDQYEAAASAYRCALQLNEQHFDASLHLGLVLLKKNQVNEAIEIFYRLLQSQPNRVDLQAGLGKALTEQGAWDQAVSCYQRAIELNPDDWKLHRFLGNALRKQKNRQEAVVAYQQAIKLNPDFPWLYNALADTWREIRCWEEAEYTYRRFLEFIPEHSWANRHLGDVLLKQHKLDEAIAAYQVALQLQPDSMDLKEKLEQVIALQEQEVSGKAEILISQGNQLRKAGKLDEAISDYHQAIQVQSNKAEAYYELGITLQQQGKADEAILYHIKAIDACPMFKQGYYCLMWADWQRLDLKYLDAAIDCCQRASGKIKDLKMLSVAYSTLGDLFTQKGELDRAIDSYKTSTYKNALVSHPDNFFVKNEWNLNQQSRGPDFFIIGGMRCGSTSLYRYLSQHPQVISPLKKEIHFFNKYYSNGVDWYLSHFPPLPRTELLLTGEASPCLSDYGVWDKVSVHLPNVKLILILRNPIDRAYSHYHHVVRQQSYHGFKDAIEQDLNHPVGSNLFENVETLQKSINSDYVKLGLYAYWIEAWMKVFPREQILILQSESFYANPAATMTKVFNFLELPDRSLSAYEHTNKGEYALLDDSLREALGNYFRPHNQRLEDFLNMKFNWD